MLAVRGARLALGGHAALAGVDLDVPRSQRRRACSVRAEAGSRRCCAPSPGSNSSTGERSSSTDDRSRAFHRTGGASASCSRTTPSSRTVTSPQTSASASECSRPAAARSKRGSQSCSSSSGSKGASTGLSGRSRAVSASVLPSHAPSPLHRGCSFWTSRSARSIALSTTGSWPSSASSFASIEQTAVYVTHDVAEAFSIAGQIAVMREGRVVQVAAPEEIWASPGDAWVARFIGLANVEERGSTAVITRPEGVVLRPDLAGRRRRRVEASRWSSRDAATRATTDGAEIVSAHAGPEQPAPGDRVRVEIDPAAVSVVPAESRPDRPQPSIGPA